MATQGILVIGGTGALGRPVVRALVEHGFQVRTLVRNPKVAAKQLPPSCEIVPGDLTDRQSLVRAMTGTQAVYLNLSHPFAEDVSFDPDYHGVEQVIEVAKEVGVSHLLRLSALGVEQGKNDWWVAQRKAESTSRMQTCGIDFTVFEADWFMESLPQMCLSRFLTIPPMGDTQLWWLAGADYGRQVAAALRSPAVRNRVLSVQGLEPLTFAQAAKRFVKAYEKRLFPLSIPASFLESGASLGLHEVSYLHGVITHTKKYGHGFSATETHALLGEPRMTIEDYARSISASRDFPTKPLPSGKAALLKMLSGATASS